MKRLIKALILPFFVVLFFSGCTKTVYDWGDYEERLYEYYQAPEKRENLKASIGTFLEEAEKTNKRIPPGLYAEYGYLQYLDKEYGGAVKNYSKEKKLFPESTYLMDVLIANIQKITKNIEKDKDQ